MSDKKPAYYDIRLEPTQGVFGLAAAAMKGCAFCGVCIDGMGGGVGCCVDCHPRVLSGQIQRDLEELEQFRRAALQEGKKE